MSKTPIIPEIKPEQSIELLKELHILTRDGKLNQDSRRKLKQVYHLYQFIEPLMADILKNNEALSLVDHGAGKSYLGFILYDLYLKKFPQAHVYGIETRADLVHKSEDLAKRLEEMQHDGLIEIGSDYLKITDAGRLFARNICMAFDLRMLRNQPETRIFSMTI